MSILKTIFVEEPYILSYVTRYIDIPINIKLVCKEWYKSLDYYDFLILKNFESMIIQKVIPITSSLSKIDTVIKSNIVGNKSKLIREIMEEQSMILKNLNIKISYPSYISVENCYLINDKILSLVSIYKALLYKGIMNEEEIKGNLELITSNDGTCFEEKIEIFKALLDKLKIYIKEAKLTKNDFVNYIPIEFQLHETSLTDDEYLNDTPISFIRMYKPYLDRQKDITKIRKFFCSIDRDFNEITISSCRPILSKYMKYQINRYSNQWISCIEKMRNLNQLSIHFLLDEFPESICDITTLEKLDLSHNYLQSISSNISKLIHLKRLDISCNNIKELPNSIYTLTDLEYLNVRANNLAWIDHKISKLKKLNTLIMGSNLPNFSFPLNFHLLVNIENLDMTDYENTLDRTKAIIYKIPTIIENCNNNVILNAIHAMRTNQTLLNKTIRIALQPIRWTTKLLSKIVKIKKDFPYEINEYEL